MSPFENLNPEPQGSGLWNKKQSIDNHKVSHRAIHYSLVILTVPEIHDLKVCMGNRFLPIRMQSAAQTKSGKITGIEFFLCGLGS